MLMGIFASNIFSPGLVGGHGRKRSFRLRALPATRGGWEGVRLGQPSAKNNFQPLAIMAATPTTTSQGNKRTLNKFTGSSWSNYRLDLALFMDLFQVIRLIIELVCLP